MKVEQDRANLSFIQLSSEEQAVLREADEVLYRFLNMATDLNSNVHERKGIADARLAMAQLGGY